MRLRNTTDWSNAEGALMRTIGSARTVENRSLAMLLAEYATAVSKSRVSEQRSTLIKHAILLKRGKANEV